MITFLEFNQDKFTFKVATDRLYNAAGVWAKADGDNIIIGVSDFFQQRNGDVAFAEVREIGTAVTQAAAFANIETIKVDVELPSPVSGVIAATNDKLEMEPEFINSDPYGEGWLITVAAENWAADESQLMSPAVYLKHIKAEIDMETRQ